MLIGLSKSLSSSPASSYGMLRKGRVDRTMSMNAFIPRYFALRGTILARYDQVTVNTKFLVQVSCSLVDSKTKVETHNTIEL